MAIEEWTYERAIKALNIQTPEQQEAQKIAEKQSFSASVEANKKAREASMLWKDPNNEKIAIAQLDQQMNWVFWFMSEPKLASSDKNPLSLDQKALNNTPKIPEKWAKPVDFNKNEVNTPTENSSSAPAKKIETATTTSTEVKKEQNDSAGTALTGSKEITKEAQVAQDAIKSGNTSPDNMQKVKDTIKNMFNSLPDGLKKFFGPILAMFEKNSGTESKDKDPNVKNKEQAALLDKYGIKTESPSNGISKLSFLPGAKVEWTKTPKPIEPVDTTKQPEKTKIQLNSDGTLNLDNNKISSTDIKDTQEGVSITIKNKDGSTDTYVVKSEKKPTTEAKA